jgi:hypothetical protein
MIGLFTAISVRSTRPLAEVGGDELIAQMLAAWQAKTDGYLGRSGRWSAATLLCVNARLPRG